MYKGKVKFSKVVQGEYLKISKPKQSYYILPVDDEYHYLPEGEDMMYIVSTDEDSAYNLKTYVGDTSDDWYSVMTHKEATYWFEMGILTTEK